MKKLLSILAVLLLLGFCLGGPVLADDVRGTELQLVVPEPTVPTPTPAPGPTPAPTPAPGPSTGGGSSNTATGIPGTGAAQTAAVLTGVLALTGLALWRRRRKQ